MAKNRVNKEGFSKLSTDKIPVTTDPFDFFNRSDRTVTGWPDLFQR
jgi:hypothetical protein